MPPTREQVPINETWYEIISRRSLTGRSIRPEERGKARRRCASGNAQPVDLRFLDWVASQPAAYEIIGEPQILAIPARKFWDMDFLSKVPGVLLPDDRPGAPATNMFWAGNRSEAGQVLHGYQSAWLAATLLDPAQRPRLIDALIAASAKWQISLHVNKGLAGAPAEAIAAGRDTATNPAMLDAFALLICASEGPPAYPGIPGHEPDLATGRAEAKAIDAAMAAIDAIAPNAGAYVSESNYFEKDWQHSFWGENYARLRAAKARYDPDGLFFVHHGVGSEQWSADGFSRL